MDRLINVPVCYSLSVNPNSPDRLPALHHPCAFFSSFMPLMNNQCWSHYCTYEINLLPAVHSDVITGKSMSPLLFSGAGRGVRTSALIIQLLTLLSESEPERERERLRRNGPTGVVYQKLYQVSMLSQTCDIRPWVSQPARVRSSRKTKTYVDRAR